MIEVETWQQILPAAGCVASLAGFLELTLVRIDMAGRASVELQILIAHRRPGCLRLMTLFAGNLVVQSRQGISRF